MCEEYFDDNLADDNSLLDAFEEDEDCFIDDLDLEFMYDHYG